MHVHGVCTLQSSSWYFKYLFPNENVSRTSTSERYVADVRRPDRTPMKVLVKKLFNFVGEIWRAYVQSRINDLRYDLVDISFNNHNKSLPFSCTQWNWGRSQSLWGFRWQCTDSRWHGNGRRGAWGRRRGMRINLKWVYPYQLVPYILCTIRPEKNTLLPLK